MPDLPTPPDNLSVLGGLPMARVLDGVNTKALPFVAPCKKVGPG